MFDIVRRAAHIATAAFALSGLAALAPAAFLPGLAHAQEQVLRVGAVVSRTGGSAALGEGEAAALELLQRQYAADGIGRGVKLDITVLDDGSSLDQTIAHVKSLLNEGRVDAIICCTRSVGALAVVALAQSAGVPLISLAAAAPIAEPAESRRWVFTTVPTDRLILSGVVADMQARGINEVVFLGLADAFGESGLVELQLQLMSTNIHLDQVVRYEADAESYTAPALAALLSRPQAVLVWGIVDDSARMVRELRDRGYGGDIYVSHGVGNDRFIELAGAAAEGVRLAVGPLLVLDDLAATAPTRDVTAAFLADYETAYPGTSPSTFAGHAYDAVQAIVSAARYVQDTGRLDLSHRVGTRGALRDALEAMGPFAGIGGVFDFTGTDHQGLDARAYVLAEIRDGTWRLAR
ncbi:MAG: ABC transporter substrate-binding protein [Trueperaceae bacterium]|nr:ABC transporter substrate-binding protein [Trueperaceae bacterium]MCO5173270.1 ABC transporter substrate-binding protein [Trueperaceae bacterium]